MAVRAAVWGGDLILQLYQIRSSLDKEVQEAGDQEAIERASKRTVKVTKTHVDDCKKLLRLMGIPYVEVRCSRAAGRLSGAACALACSSHQSLRLCVSQAACCWESCLRRCL